MFQLVFPACVPGLSENVWISFRKPSILRCQMGSGNLAARGSEAKALPHQRSESVRISLGKPSILRCHMGSGNLAARGSEAKALPH